MTDAIDENLRGRCRACNKVMSLGEMVVGWYSHFTSDEDSPVDDMPDMLIGVTHPGLCAEAFGEAAGDDQAWREFQPYQIVPVCLYD